MIGRRRKRVYLDVAASSPVSAGARRVHDKYRLLVGNPSSLHEEGRQAKKVLEDARLRLSQLARVRANDVVFTSGATESNNLAIQGWAQASYSMGATLDDIRVLYHEGAHSSIVETVKALSSTGVSCMLIPLTAGIPNLVELRASITAPYVLIVLEAVSGETGTIFGVRDVRRVMQQVQKERSNQMHLHVDASQSPRTESFVLSECGADSLSLDAQKVGGVRGVGALLRTRSASIAPIMFGGPQEQGLRPGTENPALVSSFVYALEEVQKNKRAFSKKANELREHLLQAIASIPGVEINETPEHVPHILNVSFLKRDTDYLLFLLNERGFAVSTKSACESGEAGSRMVGLMSDDAHARSTLRISWDEQMTKSELSRFTRALVDSVRFLDDNTLY